MAKHTTVEDAMTRDPITLPPSASLVDAAQTMRAMGIGDVVVADDDDVIGIVTDRDIVVRGLAAGSDPHTTRSWTSAVASSPRCRPMSRSKSRCGSYESTRSGVYRSCRAGAPWASLRLATSRLSRIATRLWPTSAGAAQRVSIRPGNPGFGDDRFLLSEGHAAALLYAVWGRGWRGVRRRLLSMRRISDAAGPT